MGMQDETWGRNILLVFGTPGALLGAAIGFNFGGLGGAIVGALVCGAATAFVGGMIAMLGEVALGGIKELGKEHLVAVLGNVGIVAFLFLIYMLWGVGR